MNSTIYPTLLDTVWHKHQTPSIGILRAAIVVVGGTLALWASAKVQIPFYPVPLSMQTFVVLLIGITCGWKLGGATIALYLFEGVVGLPVFAGTPAKGIGIAYMVGPTGGYLLGFLFAAMVTGWMAERGFDRTMWRTFFAMFIGNLVIYIPGVLWLGYVLGWDNPIVAWGVTPFLLGDFLKILLAVFLIPTIWKLCKTSESQRVK